MKLLLSPISLLLSALHLPLSKPELEVYAGIKTLESDGCDWSEKEISVGLFLKVTNCDSDTFNIRSVDQYAQLFIPEESPVTKVVVGALGNNGSIIGPNVTSVKGVGAWAAPTSEGGCISVNIDAEISGLDAASVKGDGEECLTPSDDFEYGVPDMGICGRKYIGGPGIFHFYGICDIASQDISPGHCHLNVSDCTSFKVKSVTNGGTLTFEDDALKTFEFDTVFNEGKVFACDADDLTVTGRELFNRGYIGTGASPNKKIDKIYAEGSFSKNCESSGFLRSGFLTFAASLVIGIIATSI